MTETQRTLLLIFILFIFAYQGFRRGFTAELVKFALIMLGIAVNKPTAVGQIIIFLINRIFFFVQFMLSGGLVPLFSSEADFSQAQQIAAEVAAKGLLINAQNQETALFFLMLVLVLLGYVVSARVKKRTSPLLGLFMGLINGLILAYLFVAPIAADTLLPGLPGTGMWDDLIAIFKQAFAVLLTPVQWLYEVMGAWFFVALIVLIILFAASGLSRRR
ncbi:MAG: hypothetical protein GXP42_11245 [Chloroflexi bacterium]|nr:hypothetical protein [Chloroflexota bacterium]